MIRKDYSAGHGVPTDQAADWPESVSEPPGRLLMPHSLVTRVAALQQRLSTRWTSNAWTRAAFEPATARRIAGLRYWDGRIS